MCTKEMVSSWERFTLCLRPFSNQGMPLHDESERNVAFCCPSSCTLLQMDRHVEGHFSVLISPFAVSLWSRLMWTRRRRLEKNRPFKFDCLQRHDSFSSPKLFKLSNQIVLMSLEEKNESLSLWTNAVVYCITVVMPTTRVLLASLGSWLSKSNGLILKGGHLSRIASTTIARVFVESCTEYKLHRLLV